MIPQEKMAAVTRALHETFGVTAFEDIRPLTQNPAADLIFRIVVGGSPYLLRIVVRVEDPTRHFACMKAASEAGLAPQVRYASIDDKISLTDFVDAVSFPVRDARIRIPTMLRALHDLPPFPAAPNRINTSPTFLLNQGPARDGLIRKFRAANILPPNESDRLLAWHAQVAAAYPHCDPDMVSSHCDLKPDNIVFDGHRAWLVDREAAFRNDRYCDLAVMANFLITDEAEETVYLREYFGQPPNRYQRERFFLMRQVVHMFYTLAYLWAGSAGKPVSLSEPAPDFEDFQRRIFEGGIDLKDSAARIVYGRTHWEQLKKNMRQARFSEALRIVADRHKRL